MTPVFDKKAWLARQTKVRSYEEVVLTPVRNLPYEVEQYATLNYEVGTYPLLRVRVGDFSDGKPCVLITGGVHGYEMSGILAAIRFLQHEVAKYSSRYNFLVYPCISPWSMEVNHRWNPDALDTNRHFLPDGEQTLECVAFMKSLQGQFVVAVDLHETNSRDIELEEERAPRDGDSPSRDAIPQGFYLVVNSRDRESVGPVIDSVKAVTRIAEEKTILGLPNFGGVICWDRPGLLMNYVVGCSRLAMTTEVNPDCITPEEAIAAQLACIRGALD